LSDDRPIREVWLDIAGLGIIVYSPSAATHLGEGENYFDAHYRSADQVQEHVQAGSIVVIATSTPGRFLLRLHDGYPTPERLNTADFKLRLGLRSDGTVVFRDLYDLMDWTAAFPPEQSVPLAAGIYHLTLTSDIPSSGVLGDDQVIDIHLQPLDEFPALARTGIPTL
jgi:hypothetical protein